jgi:dTDP-3-amino-3,4,6-trideoxy-alpha-D-glucose transaminase
LNERTIRFNNLALGDDALSREVDAAIQRVIASAWFVLGPEVEAFEAEFCATIGCAYGVGVASGTDALSLSLLALGVGPGDEVITSPLTAAFTALAISRIGARPVFADVEPDTLTIATESVSEHITSRTRAIVPVHLYGNPCEMDSLMALAGRHGLEVIEDACQAHAGRYHDTPLGGFGLAGSFSFYPTKNLGALGDGGLITTRDAAFAAKLKALRNGGQSSRYVHDSIGFNSRLDELQAAVLRAKLPHLEPGNARRREIAARYEAALAGTELTPVKVRDGAVSARHLFVVEAPARDALIERLRARGVETLIHYPIPVHLQPAYRHLGEGRDEPIEGSCPVAEAAAKRIVSLPLYPSMDDADIDRVAAAVGDVS